MQPSASVPRRLAIVALAGLAAFLVPVLPASAHVEATVSDGARAGGEPVTVTFSAEAERDAAGISGIKTQLPQGILPEWVSLTSGPPGWALTTTADGYQVTGAPLAPGTDAEYAIRIGTLPADQTTLVFKTLVDYTDGSEDAWIEEPTDGNPDPASPAPEVTVAPAAQTSAAPSSAPAPTSAADPTSVPADAAAGSQDSGSGTAVAVVIGIVVVVAAAIGVGLWRMRAARGRG